MAVDLALVRQEGEKEGAHHEAPSLTGSVLRELALQYNRSKLCNVDLHK